MRVLVVGATGDIGSGVKELRSGVENFVFASRHPKIDEKYFDLFEDRCYQGALEGITHCLISAGISSIDQCARFDEYSNNANVFKTIDFLSACKVSKVIPVFLSSVQVYGGENRVVMEDSLSQPQSLYGRQKLIVEDFIRNNFCDYLILRLSRIEFSSAKKSSLIYSIFNDFRYGRSLFAEDQFVNILHISDLVNLLDQFISLKVFGLFNLANPVSILRIDLAKKILHTLKSQDIKILADEAHPCEIKSFTSHEPRVINVEMKLDKLNSVINGYNFKTIDTMVANFLYL